MSPFASATATLICPSQKRWRRVGVELEHDLGLEGRVAEVDLGGSSSLGVRTVITASGLRSPQLERRVRALQRRRHLRVDAQLAQEQPEVRVDVLGILEVRHRPAA
jgi:hypothetical protein